MTLGRIVRAERGPARLPLLGKLKVGEKAVNAAGKEYPRSLDYFRADGKYAALFTKAYGEKPTKVEIVFFSPNVADVCSETYIVRNSAGRLLAEGDGEHWRCWSEKRKDYVEGEATLEEIEKQYGQQAHVSLTLRFLLPRIPSVFGIWSFTTKAEKSSIPAIRDTFDNVAQAAGALITNVPFDLIVQKVTSNRPGEKSVFPVVELIPNVSKESVDLLQDMAAAGQKIRGLLTEERIRELSAAVVVSPEEDGGDEPEAKPVPALPAAPEPAPVPVQAVPVSAPAHEPPTTVTDPAIKRMLDLFGDDTVVERVEKP